VKRPRAFRLEYVTAVFPENYLCTGNNLNAGFASDADQHGLGGAYKQASKHSSPPGDELEGDG